MPKVNSGRYPGVYTRDGGKTFCFRAQFGDKQGRWGVSGSGYRTKKEADAARSDAIKEAEAQRGRTQRIAPNVQLGEYLGHWLAEASGTLRSSSVRAYGTNVRAIERHPISGIKLRALTTGDVTRYVGDLRGQALRYDTMMGRLRTLRTALNAAVRDGVILTNPAAGIRVARTSERYRAATWSAEEALAFLRHRRDAQDPLYALWRVAVTTGMRRGELLGLRWEDLDLEAGLLEVRRQRTFVGSEVVEGPPKTASSEARVHLDRDTAILLSTLPRAAHGYVFPDPGTGRPFHQAVSFLKRWHRACADAGVPAIRFHDLRHTAATLLAETGAPMRVVQERLRHWSPAMTERYTHASSEAAKRAAESMGSLLREPGDEDGPGLVVAV